MTSSEPFDRSGPVPAAVRAAGYVSEEEEDSEEEDGSSLEEESEEEEDDEEDHRLHQHHHQQQQQQQQQGLAPAIVTAAGDAPGYTVPEANSGIQVDSKGYALEKKAGGPADGAGGSGAPRKLTKNVSETLPLRAFRRHRITYSLMIIAEA